MFGDNYHEEGTGRFTGNAGSNIYTFLLPYKSNTSECTRWIAINRNANATTTNTYYIVTRGWTNTQVDIYTSISISTNFTIALGGF